MTPTVGGHRDDGKRQHFASPIRNGLGCVLHQANPLEKRNSVVCQQVSRRSAVEERASRRTLQCQHATAYRRCAEAGLRCRSRKPTASRHMEEQLQVVPVRIFHG